MKVGIVTGLAAEARCLRTSEIDGRLRMACYGMGPAAASRAAARLLSEGCAGLVSFGCCGGLTGDLHPGTLVIASEIVSGDGRAWITNAAWAARLNAALGAVGGTRCIVRGRMLALAAPVFSEADKRALHARRGAIAVDMESQSVAAAAAAAGVPMLAIRAVADRLEDRLPTWLGDVIDNQGQPRLSRVVRGLLSHPADLPLLLRLGRRQQRALASLRDAALGAGPLLAFI